jgi:ATP-dependent Clp protease protease subunit
VTKVWNINVKRGADGSKHLDLQIHGVIDGAWLDENDGVSTSGIIAELQQHLDAKTIGVRINSIGGSAFGGIALYNALESHPAEVTATVEGLAASAASLIAMAGKTVMGRGAMMMIHPPLTIAMGNAADLRRTADMLDKVQVGLASIYTAKTGKSAEEVNALITAETWMTADEAISSGFANGHLGEVEAAPDPEGEPSEDDEEEGEETGDDAAPQMTADAVIWNGVSFPIKAVPQQVLAMAKKPVATADAALAVLAPTPVVPLEATITREVLAERAPQLLATILEEGRVAGHSAGVADERARHRAIDDLGLKGCDQLVAAAKYGDKPSDAPTLAMAAIKASKAAGLELLEARRSESKEVADVRHGSPEQGSAQAGEAIVRAMVQGGDSRRGGVR